MAARIDVAHLCKIFPPRNVLFSRSSLGNYLGVFKTNPRLNFYVNIGFRSLHPFEGGTNLDCSVHTEGYHPFGV